VVTAVESYMTRHGTCPLELTDAGVDIIKFKQHLTLPVYWCKEGVLVFEYANTFMPFAMERYNFAERRWFTTD
jgi:hypothetical protein